MAYEIKELSGALFTNDNKEHDKQPDFTGNIKIQGKIWRLAGWKTESRAGTEYTSLKVSDPEEFKRRDNPTQSSAPTKRETLEEFKRRREEQRMPKIDFGADFSDDDIPF